MVGLGGAEGYGDGSENNGRKGDANMDPQDFTELPAPFIRARAPKTKMGPFIAGFSNGVTIIEKGNKLYNELTKNNNSSSESSMGKTANSKLPYLYIYKNGNTTIEHKKLTKSQLINFSIYKINNGEADSIMAGDSHRTMSFGSHGGLRDTIIKK